MRELNSKDRSKRREDEQLKLKVALLLLQVNITLISKLSHNLLNGIEGINVVKDVIALPKALEFGKLFMELMSRQRLRTSKKVTLFLHRGLMVGLDRSLSWSRTTTSISTSNLFTNSCCPMASPFPSLAIMA